MCLPIIIGNLWVCSPTTSCYQTGAGIFDYQGCYGAIYRYPVDISGTVVGESSDCLLLSGTMVGENPDQVCWVAILGHVLLLQIDWLIKDT